MLNNPVITTGLLIMKWKKFGNQQNIFSNWCSLKKQLKQILIVKVKLIVTPKEIQDYLRVSGTMMVKRTIANELHRHLLFGGVHQDSWMKILKYKEKMDITSW